MAFEIKKGTNISHWLSQSEDRGEVRRTRFREEDVQRIARWGLDHIRIPVDEVQMWTEEEKREEEAFELLGNALKWAADAGLKVIVDLHIIRSHYFNSAQEPPLFTEEKEQEKFGRLWADLADFLKDYPKDFLAYELLNEPVSRKPEGWNRVYPFAYKQIRSTEKDRTILLGSNFFNQWQTFPYLDIPQDPNIILTFHYYNPMFITHWKASWWRQGGFYEGPIQYPGCPVDPTDKKNHDLIMENGLAHENRYFDASVMRSDISIPYQVAKQHGLRLHCGEFGCRIQIPEEIQKGWYGDLMALFNEWDIAWSNWDYRGGFGLIDRDGNETAALRNLV